MLLQVVGSAIAAVLQNQQDLELKLDQNVGSALHDNKVSSVL